MITEMARKSVIDDIRLYSVSDDQSYDYKKIMFCFCLNVKNIVKINLKKTIGKDRNTNDNYHKS